jgi:hypothetical protein
MSVIPTRKKYTQNYISGNKEHTRIMSVVVYNLANQDDFAQLTRQIELNRISKEAMFNFVSLRNGTWQYEATVDGTFYRIRGPVLYDSTDVELDAIETLESLMIKVY